MELMFTIFPGKKMSSKNVCRKWILETSLVVQWLRCHASNAGVWVQSLVGELRLNMPHGAAKKIKTKNLKERK